MSRRKADAHEGSTLAIRRPGYGAGVDCGAVRLDSVTVRVGDTVGLGRGTAGGIR